MGGGGEQRCIKFGETSLTTIFFLFADKNSEIATTSTSFEFHYLF